jgi:hypothetical protein
MELEFKKNHEGHKKGERIEVFSLERIKAFQEAGIAEPVPKEKADQSVSKEKKDSAGPNAKK